MAYLSDWDPWEEWGLGCVGYNGQIDVDVIKTLKAIRDKKFNTDIAEKLGLPEQYIELIQSILASKGVTEYGTSPRGCWFRPDIDADAYIQAWEDYYTRTWESEDD